MGRVAESGIHRELMGAGGIYRRLAEASACSPMPARTPECETVVEPVESLTFADSSLGCYSMARTQCRQ